MANTMYARSPKIAPVEPDADDANRSYLSQLALSRQSRTHGVVHTMKRAMQPMRTMTQSVGKMGEPLIKWAMQNCPKFVAQAPGEDTITTPLGNKVGASIDEGWKAGWLAFGDKHNIPPDELQHAAIVTEAAFAAELGADHGRIHPSGIVVHDGVPYARQNIEPWAKTMWAMAERHGVPADEMHALANRLTKFGRQVKPLVLHRTR